MKEQGGKKERLREEKCFKKIIKEAGLSINDILQPFFFPTFRCAFIQALSPQSYNCFHVISFVSPRPRDAKVNYSLAVQVQLDDNYTTAGSRGGKQLLSVWELIRWFSSFGKRGGGGLQERRRTEGTQGEGGLACSTQLRGKRLRGQEPRG